MSVDSISLEILWVPTTATESLMTEGDYTELLQHIEVALDCIAEENYLKLPLNWYQCPKTE